MRQKVKRRWFACLWTVFLVFLFWWFISVARRNAQAAFNNAQPNRGASIVKTKVFIIEEHQEAFLIWADAVGRNVMESNSTLVYIDSHANDRPPNLPPKSPNFRPPKTEEEANLLFQGNDHFIAAAQMSQILHRVVWIYPFWNNAERLYRNKFIDLGRAMSDDKAYVCECHKANRPPNSCIIEVDGRIEQIPSTSCSLKHSVRREAIRDVYARTRLPVEKQWLSSRSLVLAIDEDFFGIQTPTAQLQSSGLSSSEVTAISEAVRQLICPKALTHEKVADQWFYSFVDAMRSKCKNTQNVKLWCHNEEAAVKMFFHTFKADPSFSHIFCEKVAKTPVASGANRAAFLKLWKIIGDLTWKQLTEVLRVGVCLSRSMRDRVTPHFQLCVGPRFPSSFPEVKHYPTAAELSQQFDRLRAILTALPSRPRLITVARSSRDGYVPRDLQAEIEQRVLQILRDVYKLQEEDVVFDEFLLNGRKGDWYRRTYHAT